MGFLVLAVVLAWPRAQTGHPGSRPSDLQWQGRLAFFVSCDINVLDIMCVWIPSLLIGSLDSAAQSAFPPSNQLAPANALGASPAL